MKYKRGNLRLTEREKKILDYLEYVKDRIEFEFTEYAPANPSEEWKVAHAAINAEWEQADDLLKYAFPEIYPSREYSKGSEPKEPK